MTRPRVVIAGLGDTGVLTAIHLARRGDVEVVGISSKPGLVSGQELGLRLARPDAWARDYRVGFGQFRRLEGVQTLHGELTGLDTASQELLVRQADGSALREPYDVLVIATGVTNGFWRRPHLQTDEEVDLDLAAQHRTLAEASNIVVIGGGAAAVSSALQVATRWPEKSVALHFPGDRALPQHHPRTWDHVRRRLVAAGVDLRPGHRAELPDGFAADRITGGPVAWSSGQPATSADAVLWAIGRVSPNTGWLPASLLDDDGFVRADTTLQTPDHPEVFAIGDVAATDPLRSSARARADGLLARNIRAHLAGGELKEFRPARRRWGSVLGFETDGLRVYAPTGQAFRLPAWSVRAIVQPLIVRRGIYGGVRRG
ncbi:MAG: FAD-dependent oxidoreductase [Propionibacteriales bacterium]|nr:FAD-dependent oxidoreductase [Propionibacteriales bacterium]